MIERLLPAYIEPKDLRRARAAEEDHDEPLATVSK